MADPPKTPVGIARQREIIDTAMQLFAQKGVAGTTMRTLAEAVGIKAASLYNHFRSKDAILDHIVGLGRQSAGLVRGFHSGLGDRPIAERLRKTIAYWLRQGDENADIVVIFWREPRLLSLDRAQVFIDSTNDLIAFFESLIEEGIREGVFRAANARMVAFNIWGLQLAWISRAGLLPPELDIDDYAEQQADLVMRQIDVF